MVGGLGDSFVGSTTSSVGGGDGGGGGARVNRAAAAAAVDAAADAAASPPHPLSPRPAEPLTAVERLARSAARTAQRRVAAAARAHHIVSTRTAGRPRLWFETAAAADDDDGGAAPAPSPADQDDEDDDVRTSPAIGRAQLMKRAQLVAAGGGAQTARERGPFGTTLRAAAAAPRPHHGARPAPPRAPPSAAGAAPGPYVGAP